MGNTEVGPTSCFGDLVAITVYSHMYLNFKLVLDPSGERPLGENLTLYNFKLNPTQDAPGNLRCVAM